MTVLVQPSQVRSRVNASVDKAPDAVLQQCIDVVTSLLAAYTADYDADVAAADSTVPAIPDVVLVEAVVSSAAELFNQQKAPNGVLNQQYAAAEDTVGSVPIRISADPLRPAYPLLGRWVSPVTFA